MATHQATIDIDQPVSVVYNQWTQFEQFPQFMEGVSQVTQIDDTRMHWVAEIAGARREWDAEIVEQQTDQRIAWRSTSGARNAGIVEFRPVGQDRTQITLELDFEPDGIIDLAGDKLGFVQRRVESDLERFRGFVQGRGAEVGASQRDVAAGLISAARPTPSGSEPHDLHRGEQGGQPLPGSTHADGGAALGETTMPQAPAPDQRHYTQPLPGSRDAGGHSRPDGTTSPGASGQGG